jgi:hypothetical protein
MSHVQSFFLEAFFGSKKEKRNEIVRNTSEKVKSLTFSDFKKNRRVNTLPQVDSGRKESFSSNFVKKS